ncbi:NTP transferase domain-containing protein [Vreelandella lutescens]|uniref:Sugar nucleotidyltransferase n=1 Tax=Vreelandella lutescens TaxID=1602943 RepID=A0ABQ1PLS9_9GAMM|nr:phosphocholine cytidylyltransferase family protein [Halomonas lutescens]GGC99240.1 sugar nucleotidyltransferase [Halomonas lutescens]
MIAIILAAGQGTRLRPLTNNKPKCLVELSKKPLLEHQLTTLKELGIHDIHVVAGYCAEQLNRADITTHFNPNYANTNMVSTLFSAESVMSGEDDLIISYGDIVYEPKVLQTLLLCDAPICLAVDIEWRRYWATRMDNPLADAETLKIVDDNRIIELGKQPHSYNDIDGQYIGLIKVRADYVTQLAKAWRNMDQNAHYDGKDFLNMYMTSFLQHLIDSGWEVQAALIENGWAEVDCKEDLQVATQFWQPRGSTRNAE